MLQAHFDGTIRAATLLSRLATEERVGEKLAEPTRERYLQKIAAVAERHCSGDISLLTPEILVRDLSERVRNSAIAASSARLEKAAALFWIAQQAQRLVDSGSGEYGRFDSAYSDIYEIVTRDLPNRSAKTSGAKLKAFPDEAVKLLSNAARLGGSDDVLSAWLFVRANLLVGLRPTEWFDAQFFSYIHRDPLGRPIYEGDSKPENTLALSVTNAKHSAMRGNDLSRILLLEGLSATQLEDLQLWRERLLTLEAVKEGASAGRLRSRSTGARIYQQLNVAIRRTLERAGWTGEMPTVYSTRHQAVANAKADGRSAREIAALFGHSSTNTARRHYGKKYSGYSGRTLAAAPESIDAVRLKMPVIPDFQAPGIAPESALPRAR